MATKHSVPFTKHGIIVFLLWAAAPIAWYLMWKDKRYHHWFPHLLWINGTIFALITLANLHKIDSHPILTPFSAVIILTFAISQILAGLHLQKRLIKSKELINKLIIPMIIIFALDIALGYLYVIY